MTHTEFCKTVDYRVSGDEGEFEMMMTTEMETEELNMAQVTKHLLFYDGSVYIL